MRSIITFVFVILFLQTYATEQSGDKLIFKSDTMYIYNYPLDSLIKTVPPLEKKIINYSYIRCGSSDCWRGYIGTWVIQNDKLYLIKLTNGCEDYTFNLEKLFNRKTENGRIFADWFSSEIKTEYDFKEILINGFTRYVPRKQLIAKIKDGTITELIIKDLTNDQ